MGKNKTYKFSDEQIESIKAARKENKDKRVERRLLALELRAAGTSAKMTAELTGYHTAYISQLVAKFRDGGIGANIRTTTWATGAT